MSEENHDADAGARRAARRMMVRRMFELHIDRLGAFIDSHSERRHR